MNFVKSIKNISPQGKIAINLALIQVFFYGAWAFASYANIYLQQNGFSASDLGNLNAICNATAILGMMFFGMLSDKINSIKKVLILTVVVTSSVYWLTPFLPTNLPYSYLIIIIFYPLLNIFKATAPILAENITVRNCATNNVNFGMIRAFGSLFFAIFSLVAVWTVTSNGIDSSFFWFSILMIPAIICLFYAKDPVVQKQEKKEKVSLAPLLKNYFYVTFMISVFVIQFAINAELNFFSYFMESVGVSSNQHPTILAVRAIMEIPLLLLIINLRKKFKLKHLLMIACTLMAFECLLLSFWASNLTEIVISAVFYGFGNGIFIGSISIYLYKLAPLHLKASAQTIYAAVTCAAGIGGNLLGGILFDAVGGKTFYLITALIFLLGVAVFIGTLQLKKNTINPADELN